MNPLEILRRVTRPMSAAAAEKLAIAKGAGRENVSGDDSISVQRARSRGAACVHPRGVNPSRR